jgi:hypothetical protein
LIFEVVVEHSSQRSGLGEELIFEIRRARTAAKFIIKSSLLLLSPNL